MNLNNLKITGANLGAWLGTAISFQTVVHALQAAALVASISLSIVSFLWIRQQAKAHAEDRKKRSGE